MSTRAPRIGVLALQGAVAEHERALQSAGAHTVKVRRPSELDGLDGIVVPGGESTAIARLAQPAGLLRAIRERADQGMAVFGTCAGMILCAEDVADGEALTGFDRIGGLAVRVRRNAYGGQLESFTGGVDVTGLDAPLPAVFIRAPIVEEILSADVEVLATAGEHPVVVRHGRMIASSFHPELTGDYRLHQMFVELASA